MSFDAQNCDSSICSTAIEGLLGNDGHGLLYPCGEYVYHGIRVEWKSVCFSASVLSFASKVEETLLISAIVENFKCCFFHCLMVVLVALLSSSSPFLIIPCVANVNGCPFNSVYTLGVTDSSMAAYQLFTVFHLPSLKPYTEGKGRHHCIQLRCKASLLQEPSFGAKF
ncbi:hypothetical protein QYF36_015668 [Acer negundo]|nr:hypothetical protein QYF36_015668 [Acer negundo]